MLHRRDLTGRVRVDDAEYEWELRREPQWCTADGWRGMAVALRRVGCPHEAMLEFPMPRRRSNGSPQRQRPRIDDAIAVNGVRAALAAGWDPFARGRSPVFLVDAEGR